MALIPSVFLVAAAAASPPAGSYLADLGPAPDVELVEAGRERPFRLSELRGRAVLVSFIYTTCTGTCPATTFGLTRVRKALEEAGLWGDRVAFVSISLDPERDTPEVLRRYARTYRADPAAWHFLTGPPDDVSAVLAAWDMWARVGPSGALDHPSRIFLVDPRGHRREIYSLQFLKPEAVVRDVRAVLDENDTRD